MSTRSANGCLAMLNRYYFVFTVCFYGLFPSWATAKPVALDPLPQHQLSTQLITKFVKQFHYKTPPLDDALSAAMLDEYIEALDPNRSIFLSGDIAAFERHRTHLDDALQKAQLKPAFQIFTVFKERYSERVRFALELLNRDFDFSVEETYQFDRGDASWAKSREELNEIWRKRVKNDVLLLRMAEDEDDEATSLAKRYERLEKRFSQYEAEDVFELFMNAYLRAVEPHTAYFSPHVSENFEINMSLSLEGVGAVLQTIDEHTVIQRVIPGGPAEFSKQVHAEDKIIGVGQGTEGELIDVVGWRLKDVVDLIRGPKGTTVRLRLIPMESGVDGPVNVVTIVRDKIKLEERAAKKSIIDTEDEKGTVRIGVIDIPTFYLDFDAYSRGDKDYQSTTRDVRRLLKELTEEKVDGVVVDLRGNGGGSLSEAISLTGLFIKSGPVVQVKDASGSVKLNKDLDESIVYDGPLAVLVDRFSASASEIFSGAIQDYNRGVVIGEPTFGKGTVQTIIDLNRYVPNFETKLGQLKLTIAQFFRINGDSTQFRGIVPDVIFPTASEADDQGERSLDNALPWAHVHPTSFVPHDTADLDLTPVIARHQKRIKSDPGFLFLLSQVEQQREVKNKKTVTLFENVRKANRDKLETNQRERLNHFRLSQGLKPLEAGEEMAATDDDDNNSIDKIQLRESAHILVDIITLEKSKTKNRLTVKGSSGTRVALSGRAGIEGI